MKIVAERGVISIKMRETKAVARFGYQCASIYFFYALQLDEALGRISSMPRVSNESDTRSSTHFRVIRLLIMQIET
jgi:hypothetical protein